VIRVENLTRSYGEVRALAGVSFHVSRGEVVGFLGPNGAGKSTTMKILTGFVMPDGGTASIAGHDVARGDARDVAARRHVGYLPESTPLYRAMRVDRYLDFAGRARGLDGAARREALARVVEQCDLAGYTRRPIGQLSKGYKQRVGLAQALLADPDVLILDEPTSGLDPGEIVRIRDLIRRLGSEKTVLLSTHVLPEVQEMCPRVIILARGRIVADGSPLDLAEAEEPGLSVTLHADADEARALLVELEGVREVRTTGMDAAGRVGFLLLVADRRAVAEELARRVVERGWALSELRHEVPSLETVFLRRTNAAPPADLESGGPWA